mgnify:CR=1 FL=1
MKTDGDFPGAVDPVILMHDLQSLLKTAETKVSAIKTLIKLAEDIPRPCVVNYIIPAQQYKTTITEDPLHDACERADRGEPEPEHLMCGKPLPAPAIRCKLPAGHSGYCCVTHDPTE